MPISYVFAAYKAPRWSILVHDIPVGHADGGGYVGRPVDTFSTWSRRRRRRRRDEVPMYFPQTRCRESVGTCGGYVQVFQPNFQYHLLISLFTPPISLVTPYLTRRRRFRTSTRALRSVSHLFVPSTDPYGTAGDRWAACAPAAACQSCGSPID